MRLASSPVSPDQESASTTSFARNHAEVAMACLGRMHELAGVPVDESVAAIFCPTWPLLPMPVTTTRPWQPSISSTALSKLAESPG